MPKKLEEATARVLANGRSRSSWLKRSLRTKDQREANIRAKHVLIEFDSILARAEASLRAVPPLRTNLSDQEIERIADYHYAAILDEDDEFRHNGPASEQLFQSVTKQLCEAGIPSSTAFKVGSVPAYGLSDREMLKDKENLEGVLPLAQHALARGDLSHVVEELDDLLDVFQLNLDRASPAFQRLGLAVLRKQVSAFQAIQRRQRGEPVETPRIIGPTQSNTAKGETLSAALEGWKKAKPRGPATLREFDYAVKLFGEYHGDLPLVEVTRSMVRGYREALQSIPVRRSGNLLKAPLPELVAWSNKHPECARLSAASVNKLLAGPQALASWARDNGLIPDDGPWTNPFSKMLLDRAEPEREPWDVSELRLLFASSIFTANARPKGGRGEAAYWLPLLGLFTGARLGELAPLTVGDVVKDEATGVTVIRIVEDEARGRRLKTASSRRAFRYTTSWSKLVSFSWSSDAGRQRVTWRLSFRCSLKVRKVGTARFGRSGLAGTSALWASRTRQRSFTRFVMGSRTLYARQG